LLSRRPTKGHRFLLRLHFGQRDAPAKALEEIDAEVDCGLEPFRDAVRPLRTVPGIADVAAQAIVAEIGSDMGRSAPAARLVSWDGRILRNDERERLGLDQGPCGAAGSPVACGKPGGNACPVLCTAVLAHLPLALQPSDGQAQAHDPSELCPDEVLRGVGHGPKLGAALLVSSSRKTQGTSSSMALDTPAQARVTQRICEAIKAEIASRSLGPW
jgi:hypothetical protein